MGAKRKAAKQQNSKGNYNNVVDIKPFQKSKNVNILPRNRNQETYVLSL